MQVKSDAQLQKDVMEELVWDPSVGRSEIGVAASGGVVTLSGQVDSYPKKTAAIKAAERVSGVRAVADEVTVKLLSSFVRTDTDIAHKVAEALRWDTEVPDQKVKARVDGGWVWLDGEVDWEYQRAAAFRAVRYLTGVVGVSNNITLRKRAWAPEVRTRIVSALKRSADIDASRITVEANDGEVVLRGRVHSWSARSDAEQAAWSAPGVTKVKDELMVQV
jgi:osmotically-inducible protein OsmY